MIYIIINSSCSNECIIVPYNEPVEFESQAFKYDYQINDSKCHVQLHLKLTLGDEVISKGTFAWANGWFHYQSLNPKANLPLFKMSAEAGSRYIVITKLQGRNYELICSVINEFISGGQLVKEFRLYRALKMQTYNFDYVFFVTNDNGIIGSYCTTTSESQQIIALRSGRIFEELYDYSKFQAINVN